MSFKSLIQIEGTHTSKHKQVSASGQRNAKESKSVTSINVGKRGCEHCPTNNVKGVNKIKGKVRGKKIFIWGQSPGPQENRTT